MELYSRLWAVLAEGSLHASSWKCSGVMASSNLLKQPSPNLLKQPPPSSVLEDLVLVDLCEFLARGRQLLPLDPMLTVPQGLYRAMEVGEESRQRSWASRSG